MRKALFGILALIPGLLFGSFGHAEELGIHEPVHSPKHFGLLSSINLGIRYSSVLENRGVIFYRDFQIDPVLGVFLFDDKLEYLGDSIGYKDFIVSNIVRLRSRLVAIGDNPLFPAHSKIKAEAFNRRDTYEWSNQLEIFLPGYDSRYAAEIDLSYSKDILVHHGSYLEVQTKFKLFDFRIPIAGTKVEPNAFYSLAWGDARVNEYFYGRSARHAGFDNTGYGLWFAFPEEADRFYPIVQVKYFKVLGEFADAELAMRSHSGWLFSFIATNGVLE